MADRVVDAIAVEETLPEGDGPDADVRPVVRSQARESTELDSWRGEVRAIAVVAAGGLAAGAATVAALSAARSRPGGMRRIAGRRRRDRDNIIASRSFLVDVHVLGR